MRFFNNVKRLEEFKKECIGKGLLDGWMIYDGEDE